MFGPLNSFRHFAWWKNSHWQQFVTQQKLTSSHYFSFCCTFTTCVVLIKTKGVLGSMWKCSSMEAPQWVAKILGGAFSFHRYSVSSLLFLQILLARLWLILQLVCLAISLSVKSPMCNIKCILLLSSTFFSVLEQMTTLKYCHELPLFIIKVTKLENLHFIEV